MPTPRTRQPSVSAPWPHLSLLAIYSSTPIIEDSSPARRLSDEELEAAKVLYFHHSAPSQRQHQGETRMTAERKRRLMGTVIGVADFAKMMTKSGKDNKIRSVKSSKRRMVWIEPEEGIFVHATIAIPRHPSRRHARETSTATTSSSRSFPSDLLPNPLDDQLLLSSLFLAYRNYRLRYGAISGRLKRDGKEETMSVLEGFWNEWVARYDPSSPSSFENTVLQVAGGMPMSPLLTNLALAQISPVLAQFSASNPTMSPILLHGTSLLRLPSLATLPAFFDSGTLKSLVHHLLALHSDRNLAIANLDGQPSVVPSSVDSSASTSNHWTSSAFSFLDPRNVPLPSFSSTTASSFLLNPFNVASNESAAPGELKKDFAQLRRESRRHRIDSNTSTVSTPTDGAGSLRSKKESQTSNQPRSSKGTEGTERATDGGGWGLRSVSKSWSRFGAAFTGGSDKSEIVPPLPGSGTSQGPTTTTAETPLDVETSTAGPLTRQEEEDVDANAVSHVQEGTEESVASAGPATPGTPAVELDPEVDEEELREAMKGLELQADIAQTQVESSQTFKDLDEGESQDAEEPKAEDEVLKCFGGSHDEPFEVRKFERGPLTLALVSQPIERGTATIDLALLASRAARLLEAVEAILGAAPAPPLASSSSQPTFTVSLDGRVYSRISPRLGAKQSFDSAESAKDFDLELNAAFLDANRSLSSKTPKILESLTRLPTSSNWFSLTRSFHIFPKHPPSTDRAKDSLGSSEEEKTIEVVAVLPAKNSRGRETTLVEAAEGARRIERKWIAQRCGP